MPTRKASKAIMQCMVVRLCAHLPTYKLMFWCPLLWLASRNQIWTRSANAVFDQISDEGCQHQRYGQTEETNVQLVKPRGA